MAYENPADRSVHEIFTNYFSPEMRYLAAKGAKDGREIHVAVLVARLRHQVEIVEGGAMQQGPLSPAGTNRNEEGRAKNRTLFPDCCWRPNF